LRAIFFRFRLQRNLTPPREGINHPNRIALIDEIIEGIHGPALEVDADPNYEAWQLAFSTTGLLFVCSPGGAVSLFKDR